MHGPPTTGVAVGGLPTRITAVSGLAFAPTPTVAPLVVISIHLLTYTPAAAGAVSGTDRSTVSPGCTPRGMATAAGPPSGLPPVKASRSSASPGPQAQLPSLRTR